MTRPVTKLEPEDEGFEEGYMRTQAGGKIRRNFFFRRQNQCKEKHHYPPTGLAVMQQQAAVRKCCSDGTSGSCSCKHPRKGIIPAKTKLAIVPTPVMQHCYAAVGDGRLLQHPEAESD
ncbi:uncharacterized protein LOC129753960 [Uranotaenia lowii]|uniref:uncharacterized protein LOC129753960 n=1 Tax=Uranotaenia lowii TaxID=190385 RepID=UPI00247A7982|nr:uncharacterized protein LOC129753960 [Uranotaenia lowii]